MLEAVWSSNASRERQTHFEEVTTFLAQEFGHLFELGPETWNTMRDLRLRSNRSDASSSNFRSTISSGSSGSEHVEDAGIDLLDAERENPVSDGLWSSGEEDAENLTESEPVEFSQSEEADPIEELWKDDGYGVYALMFVFAMHNFQMTAEAVQGALGEGCDVPFENVPEKYDVVAFLSTPETRKERMSKWPLPNQKRKATETHV